MRNKFNRALTELLFVITIIALLAVMLLAPPSANAQLQVFTPNYWKQITNTVSIPLTNGQTYTFPGWQTNDNDTVRQANGEAETLSITTTNSAFTNAIVDEEVTADGSNWTDTGPILWTNNINSSNTFVFYWNIPRTTLDNVRYVAFKSIYMQGTASALYGATLNWLEVSRSVEPVGGY